MHILLIYQLTTEAQGIQANLKRYIRPQKQNENQNLFGFFRNFSQRKMCTHGYHRCTRGRRMGRFCSIWSGFLFCGSHLYCWASDFGPAGDSEKSWECPDLFQLPVDGDSDKKRYSWDEVAKGLSFFGIYGSENVLKVTEIENGGR